MKEDLLNLSRESDTVEEQEFNIQNITEQREAIDIINRYEEIIKTRRYEKIQGEILIDFKNMEGLSLSSFKTETKIELQKCLKKFPALKNSSLP